MSLAHEMVEPESDENLTMSVSASTFSAAWQGIARPSLPQEGVQEATEVRSRGFKVDA